MKESDAIKPGSKTRIVTQKGPEEIGPVEVCKCCLCKIPMMDKEPCGLIEKDGKKQVCCLKCKAKQDKKKKESS